MLQLRPTARNKSIASRKPFVRFAKFGAGVFILIAINTPLHEGLRKSARKAKGNNR
ncbi:hypothetical protein AWB77_05036 [Caballeronia fortuita]|uniref:Uncharacterized protein n=1 Tax=Caballeronia fortuita TaxID=1777138 RepID=A0A158D8E4_9BURK|nr:hypothetical protein AWB77_05036 [Caballeronia fortuita]